MSGRIWPRRSKFRVGYFTKISAGREGWFEWKDPSAGKTFVQGRVGGSHDDPFFILSNEEKREYGIAHFAYSATFFTEFNRGERGGFSFRLGASSPRAMRVNGPGESVRTPTVYLVRRFVLPDVDPTRAHRIPFCLPGDTAYLGLPI